ncbi:MAG: hypothetical protein GF331_18730 [Chitinivibrionales bacterium]|nr:hypothetical protein [Chitinivibrionales bacterium]
MHVPHHHLKGGRNMIRSAVRRVLPTAFGLTLAVLLSCSSEQNPFYDPVNVTMTLTVAQSESSPYRVHDTVFYRVDVHLPYLIGAVTIDPGDLSDSSYTIAMPADESVVDYTDSAFHVYTEPGSFTIEASAERSDGQITAAAASVTILGLPPGVELNADTIRVAEGARCTLAVSIAGTSPFAVQWRKGDSVLPNTGDTLIIESAVPADEGAYYCSVTSDWGSDSAGPIQLVVMAPGWIGAPTGLRLLTQSPALFFVWDQAQNADRYRVYHSQTPYDETGGYDEVTTTYYESSQPAFGHYYWIRAVDSVLVSEPSDTLFVSDTGSQSDNVPPYWLHRPIAFEVREGDTGRIDLNARCLDPNDGDTVTYTLAGSDARAWLEDDSLLLFAAGHREAGVCTITVVASDGRDTSHAAVVVSIRERTATLLVQAENGEVTRDPQYGSYRWGDTVTLAAIPSEEYEFTGWSGDTTTDVAPLRLVLIRDTTEVVALFQWAGDCTPLEPGQSLNAAIRQYSASGSRPAVLCPRDGRYDEQTIRIYNSVKFLIN